MLSGELDAFDPIDTVPLDEPAAVGAKVTVKVTLCPVFSVVGTVKPLRVNPLPLTEAADMVTAVPPVFVNVSDLLLLLPT
jgi:hypothetical protein